MYHLQCAKKEHHIVIDHIVIDHIDGNKLNNSRNNLRLVTYSLNARNRKNNNNSSSNYIGVCWNKKSKVK